MSAYFQDQEPISQDHRDRINLEKLTISTSNGMPIKFVHDRKQNEVELQIATIIENKLQDPSTAELLENNNVVRITYDVIYDRPEHTSNQYLVTIYLLSNNGQDLSSFSVQGLDERKEKAVTQAFSNAKIKFERGKEDPTAGLVPLSQNDKDRLNYNGWRRTQNYEETTIHLKDVWRRRAQIEKDGGDLGPTDKEIKLLERLMLSQRKLALNQK